MGIILEEVILITNNGSNQKLGSIYPKIVAMRKQC